MRLRKDVIGLFLLVAGWSQGALADQISPLAVIPDAKLVGKARLSYLFWDVYDAELYAPAGIWQADKSYALSLQYLRDLDGESIAARSIDEIREQGFSDEITLARWFEQLKQIIPDVDENSEIIGIRDELQHAHFFLNGKSIGKIAEPDFTQRFFAIWLGKATSEPKMRRKLLGAG